jgi:ATP-dependent RNA helicase RhlE
MARVIVFTRTKHGANKLQRDLEKAGIRAAAIHGNKSQNQRELALSSFKSQRPPVLIATDIAARGIDVDQVTHVVNFELPHEPETYVHRIGRTGRAGFTGAAVSFCDREERPRLAAIERLLRKQIPERTDLPADLPKADEAEERGPKRPPAHAGGRGERGRPGRQRHSDGGPKGGTKPAKGRRGKGKPRGEKRASAATPAAAPAAGAKPRGTKKYRRAL